MKKLLSLMLCIVFVCFAFVGCAQDKIGEYLEKYDQDNAGGEKIQKLNFYIITGEGTSDEAKTTVPQNINAYLKEAYQVELNVVYCSAEEYEGKVTAAIAETEESKRPDIILINSYNMFKKVSGSLLELNNYYSHKDFKSIHTVLDSSLLAASAVLNTETNTNHYYTVPNNHVIGEYKYIVIDKDMARDTLHFSNAELSAMTTLQSLEELVKAIRKYYVDNELTFDEAELSKYVNVVSGNYADKLLLEYNIDENTEVKNYVNVVSTANGKYQYAVINKAMATDTLGMSEADVKKINTTAAFDAFVNTLGSQYDSLESSDCTKEEYVARYASLVNGSYEDMFLLPYGVSTELPSVNFVNINSYPNTTKEEAFSSAFAIVKDIEVPLEDKEEEVKRQARVEAHYTKCMQIIFALNTDVQFKNMLQYGYVGTNYRFIKNDKNENTNYINLLHGAEVNYEMNPAYTGNLYISYFCEELGWNEVAYNNYLKQNADAKTPNQKFTAEVNAILGDYKEFNTNTVIDLYALPTFGTIYGDVEMSWSYVNPQNDEVIYVGEDGMLHFNEPKVSTNTPSIVINFSCAGETATIKVDLKYVKKK